MPGDDVFPWWGDKKESRLQDEAHGDISSDELVTSSDD